MKKVTLLFAGVLIFPLTLFAYDSSLEKEWQESIDGEQVELPYHVSNGVAIVKQFIHNHDYYRYYKISNRYLSDFEKQKATPKLRYEAIKINCSDKDSKFWLKDGRKMIEKYIYLDNSLVVKVTKNDCYRSGFPL